MKRCYAYTTLGILALAVLLGGLMPAARAANCSTTTAAGSWGYTDIGTLLPPSAPSVMVAIVGRLSADNQGNVVGTQARNAGGVYEEETLTGTWTVNPDCTGTIEVKLYDESGNFERTSVLSIVFDDNSKEVRMLQKSSTSPDGSTTPVVLTIEGRKQ